MRYIFFCIITILLSGVAQAQAITKETRQVTGYGITQSQAISDTLVRAVSQVKGVSISSDTIAASFSEDSSVETNGEWEQKFTTNTGLQQMLRAKTNGKLAGYQVVSVDQTSDGYEAVVEVEYHNYSEQGYSADQRRKIAIVPFKSKKSSYNLLGDATRASVVENELRNNLIDLFTQSRRMAVLDREYGEAFETEKELWLSDDAAAGEEARLGNVRGTDYLVVGNILGLYSAKNVEHIQLTNEDISTYQGKVQVSYKLIQAATRQVKWADTITLKFGDRQIRSMLAKFGSSQSGILHAVSEKIVADALANIYPMRVVSVKGKTVVINQGGKGLKKGDTLDVFFVGEEMFDPYTKESLGFMEEQIATVKVIKVRAKVSYTKVISGDAELIEQGAIVRRP